MDNTEFLSTVADKVALDTLWVLVAAFLVFFMNTGFGCLEAGFCRSKNTINIFAKNFVVFAIASIAFWALGFGLMFGNGSSYVGQSGFFVDATMSEMFASLDWAAVPLFAKFFFQLAFAATAATVVSGCVAERIHYGSFMIFALVVVALIYPVSGHWIWGGGFLAEMGFWDFAGSTVVHSVGGWAGLMGILLLGPRIGKYQRGSGKVTPIPGHSMALVFLGGMILWLGWFGFNPGSTMAIAGDNAASVAHIVITTNLACAAGIISATAVAWLIMGTPDFSMTVNGALAGLVAITAPCAFVTPAAALAIGLIAGVLVVYGVKIFDALRIDDPVGALSVHLLCGIWGTLSIGIFATQAAPGGIDRDGLLYGGGLELLGIQAVGVVAVAAFVCTTSFVAWFAIKRIFTIRVLPFVEAEGLDIHEMGGEAYPHEPAIDVGAMVRMSHLGREQKDIEKSTRRIEPTAFHVPVTDDAYYVRLHHIEQSSFLERWRKLCGNPQPEMQEFRDIYRHFTTFDKRGLWFRGGDKQEVQSKLQALASAIDEKAFAELVLDDEGVKREAYA